MVTDDVDENFNWISWKKQNKNKKKNTIGLRRTNDFESGPKICMNFQPQFYDNHLCHYFVHFNPSLDVYESLFLTLASQSELQEWKKGRFKHETGPWYPVAFFRQNHSTFPHALDTSLNLVELCLFYIFHTLGTSISCLCCYCFFLCQIKMSFIRYFLLQRSFHAIVPLQNYPVFPSRMTIPHQLLRGVACDIIYHFVTRRLKKLFDSGV